MSLVGADLAELSKLVASLNGPDRQQLTTTMNGMNTAVQESADWWVSEYGDRFRRDFASYVAKTQDSLDQVLAQAARVTGQNLSAIAAATGEGSADQASTGTLTDTLSPVSLTADSLAAQSAAKDEASGGGWRAAQMTLEADAAAFSALRVPNIEFIDATKGLWTSPKAFLKHVSKHSAEFDLDGTQADYAKLSYDWLQKAAKDSYPAKIEGDVLVVCDNKLPVKTFGVYGKDGKAISIYKLIQQPNKFNDSTGTPAQSGELEAVAAKSSEMVDDTSWLAKAGRIMEPVSDTVGKVMGPLAVAGDVLTIADPSPHALGGPDTERIMAAANLTAMAVTAAPVAELLAANAALDWIPGVGEVMLAATAVYFVGDLIYENRQAIGHALSWAGNQTAKLSSDAYHAATSWVSHTWDDVF
jgi:hypothetical protein